MICDTFYAPRPRTGGFSSRLSARYTPTVPDYFPMVDTGAYGYAEDTGQGRTPALYSCAGRWGGAETSLHHGHGLLFGEMHL